jgi:hypothetical protein
VRVFGQKFTLSGSAIRIHAFAPPLEALTCVCPMAFLSGCHCFLPVGTVNCVQTLKNRSAACYVVWEGGLTMNSAIPSLNGLKGLSATRGGGGWVHVRCAFFRQEFTLEDAIEFHAFAPPLEALPCVCPMAFLSGLHFSYQFTL